MLHFTERLRCPGEEDVCLLEGKLGSGLQSPKADRPPHSWQSFVSTAVRRFPFPTQTDGRGSSSFGASILKDLFFFFPPLLIACSAITLVMNNVTKQ